MIIDQWFPCRDNFLILHRSFSFMALIETLWDLLGRKLCLIFGKECASACVWMVCALILRTIIIAIRLENVIPSGIVFAFPYFIQVKLSMIRIKSNVLFRWWIGGLWYFQTLHINDQVLGSYLPLITEIFPILPNRLTDSILGMVLLFFFTFKCIWLTDWLIDWLID